MRRMPSGARPTSQRRPECPARRWAWRGCGPRSPAALTGCSWTRTRRPPWALRAAGFDQARPTAWLVEGLLIYLSAGEVERLLTAIGELSAPGSQLSCEYRDNTNNSLVARARATTELDDVTAMWQGGLGQDL